MKSYQRIGFIIRGEHLRCGIYVRVSKEEAEKNAHSASNQEALLRDWAERLGYSGEDVIAYVDANQSGGTLTRPQLGRLREDVSKGYVQCILVYKLDRLSRNLDDIRMLVFKEFKDHDIKIYFRDLPDIDFYSANGEMVFNTIASMAHWQRKYISEVTSFNLKKLKERGHMIGRPPFGWKTKSDDPKDRGEWVEDPREMEVIRYMVTLHKEGMNYSEIAEKLNNLGDEYKPRTAKWWSPKVVSDIIKRYQDDDSMKVLSAERDLGIEGSLEPYLGELIEEIHCFKINGRLPDDLFDKANKAGYLNWLDDYQGYRGWSIRQPFNDKFIFYWEKPSKVTEIIEQMHQDAGFAPDFYYEITISKYHDGSIRFDIMVNYEGELEDGKQVVFNRALSLENSDAIQGIREGLNIKFYQEGQGGNMEETEPFAFYGYDP